MRVVLADLKGRGGFVTKDTVAGGYGARLRPFSKVTKWVHYFKTRHHDTPSVQMAYLAAILSRFGHEVVSTDQAQVEGDVALVLSSLVDHRQETEWADAARARGQRVGFVGLAASKLPEVFVDHADFIVEGEPEAAVTRLARGESLSGRVVSEPLEDLDALPFPRWDLVQRRRRRGIRYTARPIGGGYPLLASRGCPEFCTYCPHRILAPYRTRSIANVVDELSELGGRVRRPYVIFRDSLFSERRERVLELCDAILARGVHIRFDCETRLDRLDLPLLQHLYRAGMRAMSFGVESVSPQTLKRVGRRPIPEDHQRQIMQYCRELGITTAAFFILGFPTDDWQSTAATIEFARDLSPTLAQFKLLTPYPATPLWRQLEPLIVERDWERFDGFTPTFTHPNLTHKELMFLLGAAYTHFYVRPSYVANVLRVHNRNVRAWVDRLDTRVSARITRQEIELMSRPVTC